MSESKKLGFSFDLLQRSGLIAITISIPVLIIAGCSIEKPQSPTWDTEFVVPLISHNYDMLELVDRIAEDNLSYDSSGNISFHVEQDIDTVAVNAGLTVDDLTDQFSEALGLIEISAPDPVSHQIMLEDYIPLILGDVAEFSISASSSLPAISDIESVTIESGSLIVTATNDFGIPLDTANITIRDEISSQVLGVVTFENGLKIGETKSESIDLSGKTVHSGLSYDAQLHSPGGTLLTVADNQVSISVRFSNTITVSSATAKIPAQHKSYSQEISFSNENVITAAEVKSGEVQLGVTNNTNLTADIEITIDQFTHVGTPLSIPANLLPNQTTVISADLSGYDFVPIAEKDEPTVNLVTDVDLPGSGVVTAYVSSDDNFQVDVNVSNVAFKSVSGIIEPTLIEIDPVVEAVDIPNGFDGFSFSAAVMEINIESAVNLPSEVEIHLEGDAGQHLDVTGTVLPGTVDNPSTNTIIVNNLSSFLDPLPHEITVSGNATVGDGTTEGSVTENDYVYGSVRIVSPLEMRISETEFQTDINEADLSDLSSEDVDRLNEGKALVHISNHLPLGATVTMHLAGDSTVLWSNPELTIGPLSVESGVVGATGLVTAAVGSDATVTLTHEDLKILDNPTLYVGEEITFPGTNGETVRIISSDFIDIEAYMTISARIGDF